MSQETHGIHRGSRCVRCLTLAASQGSTSDRLAVEKTASGHANALRNRPSENDCSVAIRLRFGAFSFYTGGDLTGIPDPGMPAWRDLETPIGDPSDPPSRSAAGQRRGDGGGFTSAGGENSASARAAFASIESK